MNSDHGELYHQKKLKNLPEVVAGHKKVVAGICSGAVVVVNDRRRKIEEKVSEIDMLFYEVDYEQKVEKVGGGLNG